MIFSRIKAYMLAFSGSFSRKCLEGISFNFFVCFIFNVSIGSAPKKKTSTFNVIPKLKQSPSLLQISCQFLVCQKVQKMRRQKIDVVQNLFPKRLQDTLASPASILQSIWIFILTFTLFRDAVCQRYFFRKISLKYKKNMLTCHLVKSLRTR